MRQRFDQLGKRIGRRALDPSGPTVTHHEIAPDARYADLRHEPDPARAKEREQLGLLGRLASVVCLIELYGHAPDCAEFRACQGKHIAFWQERGRRRSVQTRGRARGKGKGGAASEPFLWIVAASAPTTMMSKLKVERAPGWPAGVYFFGEDVLRVGLVIASELPRDRSTLLVRLMAAGPLLPAAIEELSALPKDAIERTVADEILVSLQHALTKQPSRTPQEEDFVVKMFGTWDDARELGLKQGRKEGRAEKGASDVLTVLRARGIRVPMTARKRILAEKELERLERWLKRAAVATSLDAVLDEPS